MTRHTPGPWVGTTSGIKALGGWILHSVFGRTFEEAQANARLIAAAPEMLAIIRKDAENFDAAVHGRRLVHHDGELAKERRALLARIEEGRP